MSPEYETIAVAKLISRFGGITAAADQLGLSKSVMLKWVLQNTIPPADMEMLNVAARRRGVLLDLQHEAAARRIPPARGARGVGNEAGEAPAAAATQGAPPPPKKMSGRDGGVRMVYVGDRAAPLLGRVSLALSEPLQAALPPGRGDAAVSTRYDRNRAEEGAAPAIPAADHRAAGVAPSPAPRSMGGPLSMILIGLLLALLLTGVFVWLEVAEIWSVEPYVQILKDVVEVFAP